MDDLLRALKVGLRGCNGNTINFLHSWFQERYIKEENKKIREENIRLKKYREVSFTKGQIEAQIKNLAVLLFDSNYNQERVEKDLGYLLQLKDKFDKGEIITNINYSNREKRRKMNKKKN